MKYTTLASLGVCLPRILLPRRGIDLAKWAVVACDQYTSEPEYWQEAGRDLFCRFWAAFCRP